MEQKPNHYDGSALFEHVVNNESPLNETYEITAEMRMNIGANPYSFDINK